MRRTVLFFVLASLGLFFAGNRVQPTPTPIKPQPERQLLLEVKIYDILTKKPLPEARIYITSGIMGFSDKHGYASFRLNIPKKAFEIRVSYKGYMTTIESMYPYRWEDAKVQQSGMMAIEFGMPPLARLKEASALIRDPRTLDPNRFQEHRHVTERPQSNDNERPSVPGISPTNGPTYPLPKQIKVILTSGKTITLPLEEYLKGVLPREIGPSFPAEAQKAQAVAARSYTVNYTRGGSRAICTTTRCQVWGTTRYTSTDKAVDATKNIVAVHQGKLVGGWFAASCGGKTRSNKEAGWSSTALPYLKGVTCMENKTGACKVVCTVSMGKTSTCWGVYGHRVGLCQRGAQAMGKCGKKFGDIIRHYYTGAQLANESNPTPSDKNGAKLISESPGANTKMNPGQAFTKRWKLSNTGNTTWSASGGYALVRTGGDALGMPSKLALGSSDKISPKGSKEFSFRVTSPTAAKTYRSTWQMDHKGKKFGPVLNLSIIVEAPSANCKDEDKDGYYASTGGCKKTPYDCNDKDKSVHPGAREICGNGKDDDCKGGDSSCPSQCQDKDKDGYFAKGANCPTPYDCNDNDKEIYPGAKEICGNGKDDDCQAGDIACPKPTGCQDLDGDGYKAGKDCTEVQDCNDNDKEIYPGAKEICGNGKDDDCQGGDKACGNSGGKKMGESGCQSHKECETGTCLSFRDQQLCTKRCTQSEECPKGYSCLQGKACWPKNPIIDACQKNEDCKESEVCEKGACKKKSGCGCSASPQEESSLFLLVLLFFPLLLLRRAFS